MLPEFGNHVSWYDDREHARRMAVTLDGPYVGAAARAAAYLQLNCTVRPWTNCVAGREHGRITDTNLVFSPDGELVATTTRQVLMGAEGAPRRRDDNALHPGRRRPSPAIGTYACMDGVVTRRRAVAVTRGATCCSTASTRSRSTRRRCTSRCARPENRVWIVAANKVGPLLPPDMIEQVSAAVQVPGECLHGAGESQIVAPDGTVARHGPRTGEAIVVADIDVAAAADKRDPTAPT